jgi:hypothetical protein
VIAANERSQAATHRIDIDFRMNTPKVPKRMKKPGVLLDIPGLGLREILMLVSDYTGTLSVDGKLTGGVKEALSELSKKLSLHIITGPLVFALILSSQPPPEEPSSRYHEDWRLIRRPLLRRLDLIRLCQVGRLLGCSSIFNLPSTRTARFALACRLPCLRNRHRTE